jgi:thiol-disulfide isomerase/thioredoxin
MTEPTEPPPRRPDRTWLYVVLVFALFWALYLRFWGPRLPGAGPDLERSGLSLPVDYSWRLLDLEGQPVEFSTFRGKPVFLNVWATWCGPCVREMPSIARLASDPRLKGVAFVCVATDDAAAVRGFLAERGKGWPMTFLRTTDLPPVFATDGIPATFLIAPDGRVAASQVGSTEWDDPKVVEFLLKLGPGAASPPKEKG